MAKTTADLQAELAQWVQDQLRLLAPGQFLLPAGAESAVLSPLTGDAGFRRYFRVNTSPSLLAVLAPVATEDSSAFVAIARYLRQFGVATPAVLAVDLQQGRLLIEDFGDNLYSSVISADNADRLYGTALQTLLQLQGCPAREIAAAEGSALLQLPRYDRARLHTEMLLLQQWFIPGLLGVTLDSGELTMLESVYQRLADAALQQPQVWVHRDYHSRNLIYRHNLPPGVIDFQDAVIGPLTYDLVSLLRDCYVRWPPAQVQDWALAYRQMALAAGLLESHSAPQFMRWFDWMGLQRHLKVLGIFARLWLRDGKPGYLRDLPLVLRYTLEVAQQYPEFTELVTLFRDKLLPACERQPWYSNWRLAGEARGSEPVGQVL